jgi:hypothetical protein
MAEIALGQISEIDTELNVNRLVESKALGKGGASFGGRLLRLSRYQPCQKKGDKHDAEQNRD